MIFRNVQALRAIAALLVIGVHMGAKNGFELRYISDSPIVTAQLANVGYFGVDLFFVISGFIMTVTTWNAFAQPNAPLRFLVRRIIRIYVPYWLIFFPILAFWIVWPRLVNAHSDAPPDIAASMFLLPQNGEPLLLVSWTLIFEMAFYLVFGVALSFRRRMLVPILTGWALSIVILDMAFPTTENAYLLFLQNPLALEFFFGIAAGAAVATHRLSRAGPAFCAGIGLLAILVGITLRAGDIPDLWTRVALAGPGCGLVLYAVVVAEKRNGRIAPWRLDALGDASYAMYLWHIPLLTAVGLLTRRLHVANGVMHVLVVIGEFAFIAIVGSYIYRFIERPLVGALQQRSSGWFRKPAKAVSQ